MKTQTTSKKPLFTIIAIIGAALLAYFFFIGGKAPASDAILQTVATPEANAASARILNLLNQIKSLKIETTIFTNPAYQTLQDYSVPIPAVPVGRPNPFAPIPGVPTTDTP